MVLVHLFDVLGPKYREYQIGNVVDHKSSAKCDNNYLKIKTVSLSSHFQLYLLSARNCILFGKCTTSNQREVVRFIFEHVFNSRLILKVELVGNLNDLKVM